MEISGIEIAAADENVAWLKHAVLNLGGVSTRHALLHPRQPLSGIHGEVFGCSFIELLQADIDVVEIDEKCGFYVVSGFSHIII